MRRVSGADDDDAEFSSTRTFNRSDADAVYYASRGVDRTPVSSFVSQESSRHVRDVINRKKTFFTARRLVDVYSTRRRTERLDESPATPRARSSLSRCAYSGRKPKTRKKTSKEKSETGADRSDR